MPGALPKSPRLLQQPCHGRGWSPFPWKFREVKELARIHTASEGGSLHWLQVSLAKASLSPGVQAPPRVPAQPRFSGLPTTLRLPLSPNFLSSSLLSSGLSTHHRGSGRGVLGLRGLCEGGASLFPHSPATPTSPSGALPGNQGPSTLDPSPSTLQQQHSCDELEFKSAPLPRRTPNLTLSPDHPLTSLKSPECPPLPFRAGPLWPLPPSLTQLPAPPLPQPAPQVADSCPPLCLMCLYFCTCSYLSCIWWSQYLSWRGLPLHPHQGLYTYCLDRGSGRLLWTIKR